MSNLIVWLIVGGIAGFLASKVINGRGMGVPMDIVVGIVGAFIGGFLATQAGISLAAGIIGAGRSRTAWTIAALSIPLAQQQPEAAERCGRRGPRWAR